jgi:hypothetical protein
VLGRLDAAELAANVMVQLLRERKPLRDAT